MLDKNKVQEALNRIDSLLSKARIVDPVLSRLDHIQLVQDMRILNECCMEYFDDEQELKETRTIKIQDAEIVDTDDERMQKDEYGNIYPIDADSQCGRKR